MANLDHGRPVGLSVAWDAVQGNRVAMVTRNNSLNPLFSLGSNQLPESRAQTRHSAHQLRQIQCGAAPQPLRLHTLQASEQKPTQIHHVLQDRKRNFRRMKPFTLCSAVLATTSTDTIKPPCPSVMAIGV